MPIYEVEVNGRVFEVDAPTFSAAVKAARSRGGSAASPPPEAATRGMMPPSTMEGDPAQPPPQKLAGVGIQTVSDEEWAAMTPAQKVQGIAKAMGYGLTSMMGMNMPVEGGDAGREAVDHPGMTLASAAIPGAIRGARALPTKAKAGAKFQEVMNAVGDKPIDVARPGDAALRISELAERGGAMPKSARDFLKRATDPMKPDMNYREARDFYSNITRISADEARRLPPAVRRSMNQLRVSLNDALAQTARAGGKEEVYRQAMREYAIASRMREFAETAAKYAAGAAGAGTAYKLLIE